mgnify:CR=1 FL=1
MKMKPVDEVKVKFENKYYTFKTEEYYNPWKQMFHNYTGIGRVYDEKGKLLLEEQYRYQFMTARFTEELHVSITMNDLKSDGKLDGLYEYKSDDNLAIDRPEIIDLDDQNNRIMQNKPKKYHLHETDKYKISSDDQLVMIPNTHQWLISKTNESGTLHEERPLVKIYDEQLANEIINFLNKESK